MKIAMGSDHAGFPLKEEIKKVLLEQGYEVEDVGCYSPERFDYAISAQKACDLVVDGTCEKAILCCGTGIGISMAANKVKGIRAACCSDYFSAKYTRAHPPQALAGLWRCGGRTAAARLEYAFKTLTRAQKLALSPFGVGTVPSIHFNPPNAGAMLNSL